MEFKTRRLMLRDPNDEAVLYESESAIYTSLYESGLTPLQALRVLEQLTDPSTRHHVQTILDLTPTRT